VLTSEEARAILAAIDTGALTDLRDRVLIGTIIYTFAHIGAVLQMNVGDYFTERVPQLALDTGPTEAAQEFTSPPCRSPTHASGKWR